MKRAKILPSPSAFDHAIVRVRHGNETYWLDPTMTLQGGLLRTLLQGHYGAALVIAPGVSGFETIPDEVRKTPTTDVTETFDLKAGLAAKGTLRVVSVYQRADADNFRNEMHGETLEELSRGYVNYYRDLYSNLAVATPVEIRDDRDKNRIVVTEHYQIEPAFEKEDDGSLRFDVKPDTVRAKVPAPKLTERTSPLEVIHPLNVRYRAIVWLPDAWAIEPADVTIDDPAFHYSSKVSYVGRRFDATYAFRSLADHVDAQRVPEYARKLEQVRDDASYWFTHIGDPRLPDVATLNITLVLALIVGLLAGVPFARFLGRQVPGSLPAVTAHTPTGIRGWLILPVIGTLAVPLFLGKAIFDYWSYLDLTSWNEIGTGQSDLTIQFLKLGHVILVAGGVALLAAACYSIFLLFTKRRAFPRAYIVTNWTLFAWILLQAFVSYDGAELSQADTCVCSRQRVETSSRP